MPSYTASLRLIQPATGEYSGSWGTQVNNGITALVDTSIAGTASIVMTAADYTLSTANGATDEARAMVLNVTGTPGAARNIIVPAVSKIYVVFNNTTGGFAQTVKTSAGSGISVPNGATAFVRCDGTNVVTALNYFGSLTLGAALPVASGGTGITSFGTGVATWLGTPSSANLAAAVTDETGSGALVFGTSPTLTDPVVTSLNTGQLAGMRNKLINGKMDIAQRGTSFAAVTTGSYTLDRWSYNGVAGTSVVTVSQQSDVPGSNEFQNSLRLAVTTADTSIAAGENTTITQVIEGYNARDLIGKTFTLSFWVRSSKTGTHCIAFRNSGTDRSYVAEYTVNAANTWETKSITVSGGLITAGTWNWTNGAGLYMTFALACGTTFQTTAGAWQTGNFLATSNQVNCLDSNTNIFAITGVQLEVGSVATPFEHRPYGAELALCQRYYVKTYDVTLPPANASSNGQLGTIATSAGLAYVNFAFPVSMRVAPTTVTLYNSTTGAAGTWRDGGATDRAVFTSGVGMSGVLIACNTAAASSTVVGHAVAIAEL